MRSAPQRRGAVAMAAAADGKIAGLTADGKFQELCKAEIPVHLPRCAPAPSFDAARPRPEGQTKGGSSAFCFHLDNP
jgi:hypothetical protein